MLTMQYTVRDDVDGRREAEVGKMVTGMPVVAHVGCGLRVEEFDVGWVGEDTGMDRDLRGACGLREAVWEDAGTGEASAFGRLLVQSGSVDAVDGSGDGGDRIGLGHAAGYVADWCLIVVVLFLVQVWFVASPGKVYTQD
jgi:hypothetical protein